MRFSESWLFILASVFLAVWVQQAVTPPQTVPPWLPVATGALFVAGLIHLWWSRRTTSFYQNWQDLAAKFYGIAERDNQAPLPTEKRKVSVTQHFNTLKFVDGSQPHLAGETETLSRIAGNLLKRSRVRHRRYWRPCDPRQRWVDFVTDTIRVIEPEFSKEALRFADAEGKPDRYFHFDVFHFAAYRCCQHCASFERTPLP